MQAVAPARADVFGRLLISVKNAADEKPLAGAKIVLKDTANVRPDVILTTGPEGTVTSGPLDARAWRAVSESDDFSADSRDINVVADATTEVEVLLEPLKENVIRITTDRQLVSQSQTGSVTMRAPRDFLRTPSIAGDPQNLRDLLRSAPGFVPNSVNQIHPRGEHSSTGIVIDGFYLPGVLQGRAGQILTPSTLQNIDILTGGYSPELGGETGAILNLNLRAGTITPQRRLELQAGTYNTLFGDLTVAGQSGGAIGAPGPDGQQARRFGYFFNANARHTDNALEPPQPQNQTAHNGAVSQSYFGNFDFRPSDRDELSLTLNTTPAYTEVANRTGLPGSFAPFGQGFGYGGGLTRAEARASGIVSQQAAGQDINQRDQNSFGVFSWRRNVSDRLYGVLSLGGVTSALDIRNNNRRVDLQALPGDSSIEFNPTVLRSYSHIQPQASLTYNAGKHSIKAGFLYDNQSGEESYQFIPGSQLALNALAATDTRLVGAGTFRTDGGGKAVMDRNGNQFYDLAAGVTRAPTLRVQRDGHYAAAYLQDTWNPLRRLTLNYGLRADFYRQSQNLGNAAVDTGAISPRFNLAYLVDRRTVARLSYNRLFTQPPLAQGAILGQPIRPQMNNQFDVSFERQVAPRQVARVAYYNKDIRNFLDTGLLLEGTQVGAFTTISLDRARVAGVEFTYELQQRENRGLGAYLTWANATARPGGFTNTGESVERFADHDQLNTLNFGVTYGLRNGAFAGLNLYHGSGVASSALFEDGPRQPRTLLNLTLSTGPRLFGRNGVALNLVIENLTDDRSVINFASPFSGTRFQQGRRFLVSASGQF